KAGFLILEQFAERKATTRQAPHEQLVPMASIVEVDAQYQPVIDFLLDNIFLAPEGFSLEQWSGKAADEAFVISISGHLLRAPYQLSGGAVGLFEGKRLGRLKNLEKLEKAIKALEKSVLDDKKRVQDTQFQLQTC